MDLPLPELDATDKPDRLTAVLRMAWNQRKQFAAGELDNAAQLVGAELGVPDWFLSSLPHEVHEAIASSSTPDLANLNIRSLRTLQLPNLAGVEVGAVLGAMLKGNTACTHLELLKLSLIHI